MKYSIDQNQFSRLTTRAVAIPVVGSVILSAVFVYIIFNMINVSQRVNHSNRVVSSAYEILQLVVDAESGVRGFKLTFDDKFLEPWKRSIVLDQKFNQIIDLTKDNPAQTKIMKDLQRDFHVWKKFGESSIQLARERKVYEEILPSIVGKKQMDSMKKEFENFIMVPSSTVSMMPAGTMVYATMYGLFDAVHVVSDKRVPETSVAASARTGRKKTAAKARENIGKKNVFFVFMVALS